MSSIAQRKVLIGKQASAGTPVTVDVALRAIASFKALADKIQVEENTGSFAPNRHYIGSLRAEGTLGQDGIYSEAPFIVSMAMGDVTPTGVGPFTWTFPLPDTSPPTFALYTLEYTDGGNAIIKAADVFATSLEISGENAKSWMFDADIVGAETTFPAAVGASLTPDASVSPIKMAETDLYIDGAFGSIGGTQVDGALVRFSWKLENLFHQKMFAGSLFPNGRGYNRWKTVLELIVEAAVGAIETERDKLLTTTQSAIRLRAAAGTDQATIDGMYYLKEVDTLDERDGNNILKLTYWGEKDPSNNTGKVEFVNDLAAL